MPGAVGEVTTPAIVNTIGVLWQKVMRYAPRAASSPVVGSTKKWTTSGCPETVRLACQTAACAPGEHGSVVTVVGSATVRSASVNVVAATTLPIFVPGGAV